MDDDTSRSASFVSTLPTALLLAATFVVAGFALEWVEAGLAAAIDAVWPGQVIAFALLIPAMMVILKLAGSRAS